MLTLQKMTFLFVLRQVNNLPDLEIELLQNVQAPFSAPIDRFHRIENDSAVGVKTDPVVRKDRIRCMWLPCIFDNDDVNAIRPQFGNQTIELPQRFFLLLPGTHPRPALKPVRLGRQRIALEPDGPDHKNGRCKLRLRHEHLAFQKPPHASGASSLEYPGLPV